MLTERQVQMLASLARGLSNRDMALEYGLSLNTVKYHLKELYRTLGVANRAEAAAIAVGGHLVEMAGK